MDVGRALISKIIVEQDITTVTASGIKADWFEDDEQRRAYGWMVDYYSRYGAAPTEDAFSHQYPNFELRSRVPEPFDYYIDRFRNQRERTILVDSVISANTALTDDEPKLAQEHLSKGLVRLGREVSSLIDTNAVGKMASRFAKYTELRENQGKVTGIPTGFPTLDFKTGGYQDSQFVLFGGQPKQGKSFLLMKSAIEAQEANKKVLFLSFEMSEFEQLVRYDALTCHVNATKIIHGALTDDDMRKMKRGMSPRKYMQPFIISADTTSTTTVSALAGKIEQHEPDIVFVDGVYLMDNEVGAEALSTQAYTSISRGLKRLAQQANLPIIGTTQALSSKMKGGEVTMYSLGWTSAWAQDSDLILGVERVDGADLIQLRIVAGRSVSPGELMVDCDWEQTILTETDQQEYD